MFGHRGRRIARGGAVPAAAFARAGVAALAFCAPLFAPERAGAEIVAQLGAVVAAGVTDNALSAPTGTAQVAADEFSMVRATAHATYRGRRDTNDLAYAFGANFYLHHSEGNGQTHQLGWVWVSTPTARTELRVQASAALARLNSVNPLTSDAAVTGTPTGIPSGPVTFVTGTAGASLTYRPNASRLWMQSTSATAFAPLDTAQPGGFSAQERLRHERLRARDAATAEVTLAYLFAPRAADSFSFVPLGQRGSQTLLGTALVGYRRELSAALSASLELGGLATTRVEGGPIVVGPAWRAGVRYQREFGMATFDIDHTPEPNVYVAQALVVDRATGRLAMPIDRLGRFFALAVGSLQHARFVTSQDRLATAYDLASASAALGYHPLSRPLSLSLDYSIQDQVGNRVAGQIFPSMKRQILMLTFAVVWPQDTGAGRH